MRRRRGQNNDETARLLVETARLLVETVRLLVEPTRLLFETACRLSLRVVARDAWRLNWYGEVMPYKSVIPR